MVINYDLIMVLSQERELQKQLIQLQAQYNQSLEERKEKEAMVRYIV